MKKKVMSLLLAVTVSMLMLGGCGNAGKTGKADNGELNVFIWTEYVSESAISDFQDQYGIKVNVSTYSSNEDMLSKLKSESEGTYDVLLPSDYRHTHDKVTA